VNRDEFLAFQDLVIEKVHIREMNADMFVRSLNAGEKARWEFEPISVNNNGKGNTVQLTKDRMVTARERLVELATCNEDGSRYFKDGDASAIGRKNANVVSALYDVAARLSGITKEDLEEIIKNSETDLSAGSASV
jgi:hypothetical protein